MGTDSEYTTIWMPIENTNINTNANVVSWASISSGNYETAKKEQVNKLEQHVEELEKDISYLNDQRIELTAQVITLTNTVNTLTKMLNDCVDRLNTQEELLGVK